MYLDSLSITFSGAGRLQRSLNRFAEFGLIAALEINCRSDRFGGFS